MRGLVRRRKAWAPGGVLWLCLGLWLVTAAQVQGTDEGYTERIGQIGGDPVKLLDARIRMEDDPAFAHRDYDDSAWSQERLNRKGMPARTGVYWVRMRISRTGSGPVGDAASVRIATVCAYEFYFDGERIGKSGRVGTSRTEEVPGLLDNYYVIPANLFTSGDHVLAFRVSSFHDTFPSDEFGLVVRFYDDLQLFEFRLWRAAFPMLAACLAALMAVGAVFFAGLSKSRRAVFGFGALCAIVFLMECLNAWRWVSSYPYSWHYPRLLGLTILSHAAGWLLVYSVLHRFRGRMTWALQWVLLLFGLLMWVLPVAYLERSWLLVLGHFIVSMAILSTAAINRAKGVGVTLAGFVVGFAIMVYTQGRFLEQGVFYVFFLVALVLCIEMAFEMRRERRARQAAMVNSARLEAEFAKRYLQPHFLLNTLAVLQESIETEPAAASKMIDSLGEEFRQLGKMANERLVLLEDELALCRSHLDVMSHRLGCPCELVVTKDEDWECKMPPAILHTLLENAFTHQRDTLEVYRFGLRATVSDGWVTLDFDAPGRPRESGAVESDREGTGQGMRYVRARLEESFSGRWTLTHGPVEKARWHTQLRFPHFSS